MLRPPTRKDQDTIISLAGPFITCLRAVASEADLFRLMEAICCEIGFRHFALIHHVDLRRDQPGLIRIHNYPPVWADFFIERQLYRRCPVVQACFHTCAGFAWSELPQFIYLNADHRDILTQAAREGLGQGLTVPASVVGERPGSCSLAGPRNGELLERHLLLGQLIGAFGFQAARRVASAAAGPVQRPPRLTKRQRECTVLAGMGKTDGEIAGALGLERNTVIRYLAEARARYGVFTRQELVISALINGEISLAEVMTPGIGKIL